MTHGLSSECLYRNNCHIHTTEVESATKLAENDARQYIDEKVHQSI